jgi:hypothetical protein
MNQCKNCKWFFLPKDKKEEFGLCKMFGNVSFFNKKKLFIYEFAEHCRKNKDNIGRAHD